MSVASRFERWRDYPFAVAGPVSLTFSIGIAVWGGLCALLFSHSTQFFIALAGVGVLYAFLESRRRAFARRRGITRLAPLIRRHWGSLALAIVGVGAFELIHSTGWGDAWTFVLYAGLSLLFDVNVRRKWMASGCPGDPRWQQSWAPES